MRIDVWKLTGVNFPMRFIFLSADLAKIGDAVLRESRRKEMNDKIEFLKSVVLNGFGFFMLTSICSGSRKLILTFYYCY